jgi:hypothetical protein
MFCDDQLRVMILILNVGVYVKRRTFFLWKNSWQSGGKETIDAIDIATTERSKKVSSKFGVYECLLFTENSTSELNSPVSDCSNRYSWPCLVDRWCWREKAWSYKLQFVNRLEIRKLQIWNSLFFGLLNQVFLFLLVFMLTLKSAYNEHKKWT